MVAADSVSSALALWRGSALQGLTGTAWFRAEAGRLDALHVDALEDVGTSRLAVETARAMEPEFPDGIWFADFARGEPR